MPEAKRRGRPPLSETERKGRNLTFRSRNQLRKRLVAAARSNKRSMSEEIEGRLESTFSVDPTLEMIFSVMNLESLQGKNWKDDQTSAETVRAAVDWIIADVAGLPIEAPTLNELRKNPDLLVRVDSLVRVILRKANIKCRERRIKVVSP